MKFNSATGLDAWTGRGVALRPDGPPRLRGPALIRAPAMPRADRAA